MAGVMSPGRRGGTGALDAVLAGLQVASQVYGMKQAGEQADRLQQELEMKQAAADDEKSAKADFAAGKLNKGQQIDLGGKGFVPAKKGDEGAFSFTDKDSGLVSWVKKAQAPKIAPPTYKDMQLRDGSIVRVEADGSTKTLHKGRGFGTGAPKATVFGYTDAKGNERAGKSINGEIVKDESSDPITKPVEYTPGGIRKTEDLASAQVDGLELQQGKVPTAKDAETVKVMKTAYKNITDSLKRLDSLYLNSGTNLVGDDAASQEALVTDIQMNLKELEKLGVLNGPDLPLLMKQVPDPTSFMENLKGMVGSDRYATKSIELAKTLKQRYKNELGTRGYQEPTTVVVSNGKETLEIPIEDLAAAQGDGYRAVGRTAGVK